LTGLAGRTDGITVDWTWDSLKLGDGGEYGEEWGSMHERFARGFKALLRYYQDEENRRRKKDEGAIVDGENGGNPREGEETVVILVTHGAGCNALLGALTQKPVLIDIPISSLSLAVLRPATPSTTPSQCEYELLLQADTAHLTTTSPPSVGSRSFSRTSSHSRESSQSRSPIIPDKRVLEYHPVRSRSVISFPTSTSDSTTSTGGYQPVAVDRPPSLKVRTSSGSFRRQVGLFRTSSVSNSPRTGLWTPISTSVAMSDSEEEDVEMGTGARRKRAVGLWKNWAGDQAG